MVQIKSTNNTRTTLTEIKLKSVAPRMQSKANILTTPLKYGRIFYEK